jgi:hypothetical protein
MLTFKTQSQIKSLRRAQSHKRISDKLYKKVDRACKLTEIAALQVEKQINENCPDIKRHSINDAKHRLSILQGRNGRNRLFATEPRAIRRARNVLALREAAEASRKLSHQ